MKKKILAALLTVITLVSCNSTKDVSAAYNMVNCKYAFESVSGLTVSGMDLSNGFSLAQMPKITSLLSGKSSSIPVSFDLNVGVKNPGTSPAMLHGMQYIVSIDDIEFTTGQLNNSLNIGVGETQTLPIGIGVDLMTLFSENSKESVLDIARNIIGIGTKQSRVTLRVKPTFMIKGVPVTSPVYIPINFTFGGKKSNEAQ